MKAVFRSISALAIMGAALALNACKDLGIGNNELGANGRVRGEVLKADGAPIVGAMVTFNGDTAYTDTKGSYTLRKAQLINERARVKVEKQGFFTTEGVAEAYDASSKAVVNVFMRERVLVGQFSAATGGRFTLGNNTTITIAPNAYRTETGGIYSGMVNLYAAAISPYDANLNQTMPGGMLAQDPTNPSREVILQSAGAFFLEEEPADGRNSKNRNRLIRTNNGVYLCTTVNDQLRDFLAVNPVTLWYWKPGMVWSSATIQGTLNGNEYCFAVEPEFNSCNLDVKFDLSRIRGKVCNEDGFPVPNTTVSVGQLSTTTDDNGNYMLFVPAGRPLIVVTAYSTQQVPQLYPNEIRNLGSAGCNIAFQFNGRLWFNYLTGSMDRIYLGFDSKLITDSNDPWQINGTWNDTTNTVSILNPSYRVPGTEVVFSLPGVNRNTRFSRITNGSFMLNGVTYSPSLGYHVEGFVELASVSESFGVINSMSGMYYLIARIPNSSRTAPVLITGNFGYSAQ